MKNEPCWAWYLYCTLFQLCQSTFSFSLMLMRRLFDRHYWLDSWFSQPDYKWKEQARTDTGTGSLVQTSRNFIKQNLLLRLCKSLVLMTASPSTIFRCCSGRSTFRWCSEMCKNYRDFVSCRPFRRGERFTVRVYLLDKSKQLST